MLAVVPKHYRFTDDDLALVRRFESDKQVEQGGLAGPVCAYDAQAFALFEMVGEAAEQGARSKSVSDLVEFDQLAPHPSGIQGDVHGVFLQPHLRTCLQVIKGVDPRF